MSMVEPYIDNIRALQEKIPELARDAIIENAGEIVNLVKFEQLSKGLNSFGKPLAWSGGTGFYAMTTQAFATRDKVPIPKTFGAPYNFSWSGEALDNMYLEFIDMQKSEFHIFTVKSKEKILEDAGYGKIFDLTEEHNKWVNENIILPYIENYILDNMFNI